MKVLKNIIEESEKYYRSIKKKIERQLVSLPRGSVKVRKIGSRKYYYHQFREGAKVVHRYLGKENPGAFQSDLKRRNSLRTELNKVKAALKIIKMSKGRKRD